VRGGARAERLRSFRLLRPLPLSALCLLYAAAVAVHGFEETSLSHSLFCTGEPLRGANIGHGLAIAFFASLGGLVLLGILYWTRELHQAPGLVISILLLAIAALGLAIAFVALDSATYVQQNKNCGFFGPSTGTDSGRAGDLYYLWAIAIAILLVQAARVLRQGPAEPPTPGRPAPEPPKSKYEQPGWLQSRPQERREQDADERT
jgi:hypothetical protein